MPFCCRKDNSSVPTFTSCRYVIAYIAFVGFVFVYVMRFNFSMAIVCMVDENSTSPNQTTTIFNWSRELQGHLLSSFFYGYLLTQMPGGYLADRYGGKLVFFVGMVLSAVATILSHVAAEAHYGVLIVMRFLIGIGTGVVFPCMHAIWANWAPLFERTKLINFTYSGSALGSVSAYLISGILCDELGWPSIFYFSGGLCLLWCLSWWFGVYSSPRDHPCIKKTELDFIEKYRQAPSASAQKPPTPWKSILTSLPVWAICAAHVSGGWMGYTILVCVPMYMKDVLQFDIKSNGFYSSIPNIVALIGTNIISNIVDLIRSKGVRTVIVRKVVICVSCVITVVTTVWIGFLGPEEAYTALALLIVCMIGRCFSWSGYSVNHVDIAPRYAGLLLGFTNTFATITGILTPIVVGQITPGRTRQEWQIVFIICAVVSVVGNTFYLVFAQCEEQEWAKVRPTDRVEVGPMN